MKIKQFNNLEEIKKYYKGEKKMEKGRHCASNFKKIIFYSSKENKALTRLKWAKLIYIKITLLKI